MFTDKIEPIIYNGVADIGGKYFIPKGIGTVRLSETDDEGQLHTKKLNNVLCFTNSPVKIICATVLDESMKYSEGTWVPIKIYTLFLLGILGSKRRQYLTQRIFFHN